MSVLSARRGAGVIAALAIGVASAACDESTPRGLSSPSATPASANISAPLPAQPVSSSASAPAAAATTSAAIPHQPIAGGPTLLRAGIELRKVTDVEPFAVRLARNPKDGELYLLNPQAGLARVDVAAGSVGRVARTADIVDGVPAGLAFGPDGTAYLVANKTVGKQTHAIIRRGVAAGEGGFAWTTLATTIDYPLSGTPFDHVYNGIVVSPDGRTVYVNAGSRTDHGEVEDNKGAFPGVRELPLTSAIFALPADATDLRLDDTPATINSRLYADGTRNAYSLAFAPTGELFAVDNGPDADYPDELNLIEKGKHYGFPWRFGSQDNPQAQAGYDPKADRLIQPQSGAALLKTYYDDPTFPAAAAAFTDALLNAGPDGAQYRDADGNAADAAKDSKPVATFTPHRSPLGLVFSKDSLVADSVPGQLHALLLSWGSMVGDLSDRGRSLEAITLTKGATGYSLETHKIADGFKFPIDQVLIDRRLYVLEFGEGGAIWELTFAS